MRHVCLNCDAPRYSLFDPCIDCGMRPTDPALRRGAGKEQYEKEQGHHRHAASIKARREAAAGLQGDLLSEVPMLFGPNNLFAADVALGKIHREGLVKKHGGGLPGGVSTTSGAKLPMERPMEVLFVCFMIYKVFFA